MGRPNISCLLWGHNDYVHRSASRIFLECLDCGRETRGWELSSPDVTPTPHAQPSPFARPWPIRAFLSTR